MIIINFEIVAIKIIKMMNMIFFLFNNLKIKRKAIKAIN